MQQIVHLSIYGDHSSVLQSLVQNCGKQFSTIEVKNQVKSLNLLRNDKLISVELLFYFC